MRLLLDSGSNSSFVVGKNSLKKCLKFLGKQTISIQSMGTSSTNKGRDIYLAKFALSPSLSKPNHTLSFPVIMVENLCGPIQVHPITPFQKHFVKNFGIKLADPDTSRGGKFDIDFLIGQDNYHQLVKNSKISLSGGLVLINTLVGYSLAGKAQTLDNKQKLSDNYSFHSHSLSIRPEEMQDIKKLVSLETLGVGPIDEEVSPVLDRFNHTTRHTGERYSAFLPRRHKIIKKLPTNFAYTFKRLVNNLNNLQKAGRENDLIEYSKIMNEQLQAGVLERVKCIGSIDEIQITLATDPKAYDNVSVSFVDSSVHYLPHFSVRKRSSGKLRLVYDASAKSHAKSYSLNDCLETGPDLINSLLSILIRFRTFKYALKSDIQKAFLQIEIEEYDRDLLRTLWVEDEQVWIYRFARLPFGLTCSPFILAATLKKHLTDSNVTSQQRDQILSSFYVDNYLTGEENVQSLIETKSSLEQLFSKAGMSLHEFNSNNLQFRKYLNDHNESFPDIESFLGIKWNVNSDEIGISNDHFYENLEKIGKKKKRITPNTKRWVYSKIGQTHDVLGLISPYMFMGKLILRDICEDVKPWDSKLPPKYLERWNKWSSQLSLLEKVKIPRYVGDSKNKSVKLVGFCDASILGFAACIYYVVTDENGLVSSNLLVSKTHLASRKVIGIPRLELCAALLLSNLLSHVRKSIKEIKNNQIHLFTDSADILYWIRSESLDWPIFVANRLQQISNLTEMSWWKHVNTKDNPADIPSRGCTLSSLLNNPNINKLWFHGPDWLLSDIASYKSEVDLRIMPSGCRQESSQIVHCNQISLSQHGVSNVVDMSRYSTYEKLINVTAYVFKAIDKLKCWFLHKQQPTNSNVNYTRKAQLVWIKSVQMTFFREFFTLASDLKKPSTSSVSSVTRNQFTKMNVFLDGDLGILRCKSRTSDALQEFNSSNPILLATESNFVTLLVKSTHQRLMHSGISQTVAAIRQEFWVPRLTKLTSSIIKKCMNCKKMCALPYSLPNSPSLPDFRVQKARAFTTVGIDFAGPFTTREYFVDGSHFDYKSYVLIFTCAVTRGVYFEALNSLNTFDFLLALERFISERGAPDLIVSDNAKTMKSVNSKFEILFNDKTVQAAFSKKRIQWKFYTEKAPWMGGFIERIVALYKNCLYKTIGPKYLSFEEFKTVTKSSQAVVNSRPLTYLCEGINEITPLTPSKLINGYNITDLPSLSNISNNTKNMLKLPERYLLMEKIKSSFWKQYYQQYLTELQQRHINQRKSTDNVKQPKVGDVCLLKQEKVPRLHWPLAIIENVVYSARDNKIRTLKIRTINENGKISHINRSPSFLIPLEEQLTEETNN